MKKMKKTLSLVLVFALILSTILIESSFVSNAKVKIRLNKKKVTLTVGKKTKLKLKNYKKKVKWSSSKKKVATVNKKGVVTAKKKGTAKITAKAGKKKYVCKVTVKSKKKSKVTQTPNIQPSSVPSVVPIPQTTETPNNQITPSESPVTTPAVTPDTTPETTPTVTPDATPEATPTVTPDVTPEVTPTITPDATPVATPTSTPASAEMADIPKFLSFKTYEGEEIITEGAEVATFSLLNSASVMAIAESATTEFPVTETTTIESNWINKNEMVLLKLSYENKKRDSIIEIVLNDSDYGNKQIYTTAASVNKILSSDTYYDEEKDSYITDILLQMPATKSETERIIEIEETCFLRETIGKKGYADMSTTRQTTVTLEVSQNPIPSYSVYFNFVENENDGYTLISLTDDFDIPKMLYIPEQYNGLPVNEIGATAFEKSTFTRLIVPSTITAIGLNLFQDTTQIDELIMLCKPISTNLSGYCKRIVTPKELILEYARHDSWNGNNDVLYFHEDNGECLHLNNLIPQPEYTVDFPSITISINNEALATYGSEDYRNNVVWDEKNHTVSYNCKKKYNSGIAFNLNPNTRAGIDLSSYRYIKCDVETDEDIMVKLLADNGIGGVWTYQSQLFECDYSETWHTGRRIVYLPIPEATSLGLIEGLLIAPNKEDAHIKIYNIEFTTTRDDLEELPACTYNENFPKVTISENNEGIASCNDDTQRTDVIWDEENHTVEYTVPTGGNGLILNIDSVNREAVDLSPYNYVKCVVEVDSDVTEALFYLKLHQFSELRTALSTATCYETDENALSGKKEIYFELPTKAKQNLIQSISMYARKCDGGWTTSLEYQGKLKIHSIEFVTEKLEE